MQNLKSAFYIAIGHTMAKQNFGLPKALQVILHPNDKLEEEVGENLPKLVAELTGVDLHSILDVYRDTIKDIVSEFGINLKPVVTKPQPMHYPKRGVTYTLREIEESLILRDSACLLLALEVPSLDCIRRFAVQTAHHGEEVLLNPDIANSKWEYIRETDEWVPVFLWAKSNTVKPKDILDIEEYNDKYFGGEDGNGGASLWLTFKGFPRLNPEKEDVARSTYRLTLTRGGLTYWHSTVGDTYYFQTHEGSASTYTSVEEAAKHADFYTWDDPVAEVVEVVNSDGTAVHLCPLKTKKDTR